MQRTSKGQKKMFCPTDRTPAVSQGASGNHLGAGSENQVAGYRAALAAGRQPVDFAEYGPVDRAVCAEIGRYQTQSRKSIADRARLRRRAVTKSIAPATALILRSCSKGMTSYGGFRCGEIRIRWWDGVAERCRTAIGYVGEDGIKAGIAYVVREKKLVEKSAVTP